MLNKALNFIRSARSMQRVNLALSRAATTSGLRNINPHRPTTWEFCGFSQNGEDGITDFLCQQLSHPNRYFVEIGAADGLENNTAWLAIAKKYSGLMIEGNSKLTQRLQATLSCYNLGVESLNMFVTKKNITQILEKMLYQDPDVFSLDIDGNDYHVMQSFLENHFRPKIIIVEYNSAFGPTEAVTIPYQEDFNYMTAHDSGLYYGVSITAWRKLMSQFGYHFVTVENNGVNAFFIDANAFSQDFIKQLQGLDFAENFFQRQKFKNNWSKQFQLIQHLTLEAIA